eukprot:m.491744 g.491744  ORF g.491744 m.491744 type:complete len:393 (-) comp30630_c0_seq1:57-1235(-)
MAAAPFGFDVGAAGSAALEEVVWRRLPPLFSLPPPACQCCSQVHLAPPLFSRPMPATQPQGPGWARGPSAHTSAPPAVDVNTRLLQPDARSLPPHLQATATLAQPQGQPSHDDSWSAPLPGPWTPVTAEDITHVDSPPPSSSQSAQPVIQQPIHGASWPAPVRRPRVPTAPISRISQGPNTLPQQFVVGTKTHSPRMDRPDVHGPDTRNMDNVRPDEGEPEAEHRGAGVRVSPSQTPASAWSARVPGPWVSTTGDDAGAECIETVVVADVSTSDHGPDLQHDNANAVLDYEAFKAISEQHRRQRDTKTNPPVAQGKLRSKGSKPRPSESAAFLTAKPPTEAPLVRHQRVLERLYGQQGAAKIALLESAADARFDLLCHEHQPQLWPSLPFVL